MQRDRMRKTLGHIGVRDSSSKVLKLLPLVYVAWCSGNVTQERRARLLDLAHNYFSIGNEGEVILDGWLVRRPTLSYFKEGLRDLAFLARAPDELSFDVEELAMLLAFSEAIARTTLVGMDGPESVTDREDAALLDVARELGVDVGESWRALLRELARGGAVNTNRRQLNDVRA